MLNGPTVRGLNNLTKHKQVLNRIKQMKSNIVFIQETHLPREDIKNVNKKWPGKIYSTCFTHHARGFMILIHKSVLFQLKNKHIDPPGRYIILNGIIVATQINVINVYTCNIRGMLTNCPLIKIFFTPYHHNLVSL